MKKRIYLLIALVLTSFVHAQTDSPLAMGKWKTHLSYNSVSRITQSPTSIYAVSDGALFSIGKEDMDEQVFSKISGLNDVAITKIAYDEVSDQLLIIYQNGNIDLMHSMSIYNIPFLYKKHMSSTKTINDIYFHANRAYLSCDFGIMVLNLTKREIADTYIIGPNATEIKVISTTVHDNTIYAVTENEISEDVFIYEVLQADANNPSLVNFEFWHATTGLPGSGKIQQIFTFSDKLMFLRNNKLYVQDSGVWTPLLAGLDILSVNVSHGKLIANNGTTIKYIFNESFELSEISMPISPDIAYDLENDSYWLAGGDQGVISFKPLAGSDPLVSYFKPKGPAVNIPWNMTFSGGRLFVVPGGRWGAQYGRSGTVMIYENGTWKSIVENEISSRTGRVAWDFMNVAVDPDDNKHFFVTSYGTGLYEFKNDSLHQWHTHYNSTIESIFPGAGSEYLYIRLDGAVFDKDGNLYVANTSSDAAIKILTAGGEWKQLSYPNTRLPTLGKILINNQNSNQKWLISVRSSPGIFIWDDKGILNSTDTHQHAFFSSFDDSDNLGGKISPTYIYTMEQDKNGVIWVGTDMGPLLFYNTSKAFDSGYTCSRVKIPRNDGTDLADYLLQSDKVKAILIDGANRKWIGTENSGLYLMSENGQETIHHFTSANSPLLSDDIMSLSMNPETGELFIGTADGLISYQTDAAEAENVYTNVYAYPNPVRENYHGIITITGLVERTQVKITDLNGNLIYQTVSNGSIATWDGKDKHGKKVNTGIYFAICATHDGSQSAITKIMVIN